MVKKCIYCSAEVGSNSVVDMCKSCMYQVWGEKMAKAIIENMERERDGGNLDLGQVGKSKTENEKAEPVINETIFENKLSNIKENEPLEIKNQPMSQKIEIVEEEITILETQSEVPEFSQNEYSKINVQEITSEELQMEDIPRFD